MHPFGPEPILWIQRTLGPGWARPFEILTDLGTTWGLILVAGIVLWLWGRKPLYGLLALAGVEAVAKTAIASIVSSPRPSAAGIIKYQQIEAFSSFPSGHVSSATAMSTYLGFIGRIPLSVGVTVGIVIAITRLYLGVHWVIDVVAGLGLGMGLAWIVARFQGPIAAAAERVPFAVWAGFGAVLLVGGAALVLRGLGPVPPRWTALGFVAGLGAALPLERRYVQYEPGTPGVRRGLVLVALGSPVVLGCLWAARRAGEEALLMHGVMAFVATLWALLGAPALINRMDTRV